MEATKLITNVAMPSFCSNSFSNLHIY